MVIEHGQRCSVEFEPQHSIHLAQDIANHSYNGKPANDVGEWKEYLMPTADPEYDINKTRIQASIARSEGGLFAHDLPGTCIPFVQKAVVSPKVQERLNLEVCTIPVRDLRPGEVLVRILCTGICRSDASFSVGPYPGFPSKNYIAGHEGIGNIVRAFDASMLGRLVGIRYLGASCQTCTYCLQGLPTSCPRQLNSPRHVTGTFQEFAVFPLSCLLFLPEDLLMAGEVPLHMYTSALCSGSTALAGLKAADVRAGQVVLVLGIAGAIGHLTGAIAKQVFGAMVIGVDLEWKIDALPAGSDHFGDLFLAAAETGNEDSVVEFQEALHQACTRLRPGTDLQRNADAAIIASSCKEAFEHLDTYVCDGGRIVCLGVPKGRIAISAPLNSLVERNLRISGNLMGGHNEALEVINYIASKRVTPFVKVVSLAEVPEQMQMLVDCKTVGKVVMQINRPLMPTSPAWKDY